MSETPGGPEYYTPPTEPNPPPAPAPYIGDAAQQWSAAQESGQQMAYQPPPPATPQYAYAPPAFAPRPSQGLAVAALVVGIVALITGWVPVWGIIIGLVAIVLGAVALAKRQSKGMAIGGIATGAIGTVFSAIVLIFIIFSARWASDPDNWFSEDPSAYFNDEGTTLGPTSVDGGLAVVEQGFGQSTWDDATWWYVVILDNPSDSAYNDVEFTVNAIGAGGQVIDSSWNYLTLPSGRTAIAASFYDIGSSGIASLEVIGPDAAALAPEPSAGTVTIENLTPAGDSLTTTVSGVATSTLPADIATPMFSVVARDASGTIVGAQPGYAFDELSAGGSTSFEAYFDAPLPDGTTYEAYWYEY